MLTHPLITHAFPPPVMDTAVILDPLLRRRLEDIAREIGVNNIGDAIKYLVDYYELHRTRPIIDCGKVRHALEYLGKPYVAKCLGNANRELLRSLVGQLANYC